MWNGQTGQFMNSFFGHTGKVLCGSFTVDGKQIITGSEDGTIKIWDPKSAACLQTIEGKLFHESPIVCLAPHPSGQKLVLSGGEDGSVRLSNYETGKVSSVLKHFRLLLFADPHTLSNYYHYLPSHVF